MMLHNGEGVEHCELSFYAVGIPNDTATLEDILAVSCKTNPTLTINHLFITPHFQPKGKECFSSVQFSHSVVSTSLQPHESQHTRLPCPSPTLGVHSNSCP